MIKTIYSKSPPAVIYFTDSGLPQPVTGEDGTVWSWAGQAKGCVVRIRPEYANDDGIREHELSHVTVFWYLVIAAVVVAIIASGVCIAAAGVGMYLMLVWGAVIAAAVLIKKQKWFKLRNEAIAYATQLKFLKRSGQPSELNELAARLASPIYPFKLTQEQAVREITRYI